MNLTLREAERILTKIFADEIGSGGSVTIGGGSIPDNLESALSAYIHTGGLDRLLKTMTKNNQKIEAIKLYREFNRSAGLGDAKVYVERLAAQP